MDEDGSQANSIATLLPTHLFRWIRRTGIHPMEDDAIIGMIIKRGGREILQSRTRQRTKLRPMASRRVVLSRWKQPRMPLHAQRVIAEVEQRPTSIEEEAREDVEEKEDDYKAPTKDTGIGPWTRP